MISIESLTAFLVIAFAPHFFLYEFYLFAKYVILAVEMPAFKRISKTLSCASILMVFFGFLVTCCCCFCCCFNCCCQKEECCSSAIQKVYDLCQKLSRFLVKVLFGPKEGVVERFAVYKKDEEDEDGIPILYIRNVKLNRNEISSLAILIMAFSSLAAITAWDSFFLNESYICSERSDVSCFPVALDFDANEEFNLTDAQTHPVTNCSYWEKFINENATGRVAFICFQWAFDSKAVISDVGGLLTMFLLTMKITSSGFLTFLNWAIVKYIQKCIKKSTYEETDEKIKENDIKIAVKRFKLIRLLLAAVTTVLEFTFGFALISITTYAAVRHDNKPVNFIYDHGNQMLLIFGIFSTLLFLPLEKYAMAEEMPTCGDYDEERALPPGDKNEYIPLTN